MDAYDIFKKLSRGAHFSRPCKSNPPQVLKIEPIKVENVDNGPTPRVEKDNPITVLSAFTKHREKRLKSIKCDERKKLLLKQEQVNHYRNLNKISAVGKHVPEPIKTFDECPIDQLIIKNLKNCGYVDPTPVQKQAIPVMLQGRHMLACAPTGSGKTAAFLVPIIHNLNGPSKRGVRALILCPTRELAKQTQRECFTLSEGKFFRVHVINKIKQMYGPNTTQKSDILITTPNRLCFLLKQDPPLISLANIEWLVIDEADKLFENGNRSFREQLDEILAACTNKNKIIAMFSATFTPIVAKWCVHNMKALVRVTVGARNAAADSVDQQLLFVGNEQGKLLAFRDLIRKGLSPPVLVFVQSKERAQQLFSELIYDGINVDAIHADRTQLQRDNTVRSFREGKIWVLICTELMARGIDFKGVNLVINYDFPPSAISYVHRVGRAGRAGRTGKAITFFTIEDTVNLKSIANVLKESGCEVPQYMLSMKKKHKRERKQLEKAAPKRDDITTTPKYELLKRMRKPQNVKRKNEQDKKGSIVKNAIMKKMKNYKDKKNSVKKEKKVKT